MNRIETINQAFRKHGTDKVQHNYAMVYSRVPQDIKSVLEVGVSGGHSLLAWTEIFPLADIYGIDLNDPKFIGERIHWIKSDIRNFTFDDWKGQTDKFDLIVDDASHHASEIIAAWKILHSHAAGLYVIEDVVRDEIQEIMKALYEQSNIVSAIQTSRGGDDRCIVAQFDRIIEW